MHPYAMHVVQCPMVFAQPHTCSLTLLPKLPVARKTVSRVNRAQPKNEQRQQSTAPHVLSGVQTQNCSRVTTRLNTWLDDENGARANRGILQQKYESLDNAEQTPNDRPEDGKTLDFEAFLPNTVDLRHHGHCHLIHFRLRLVHADLVMDDPEPFLHGRLLIVDGFSTAPIQLPTASNSGGTWCAPQMSSTRHHISRQVSITLHLGSSHFGSTLQNRTVSRACTICCCRISNCRAKREFFVPNELWGEIVK